MELPIEEFQRMFDEATKCKTSGKITGYEILKKYDDCNYFIKIDINGIVYYTDVFHNKKKCSQENNKKLLDELYPKEKEIDVIVDAEQDYVFLADKSTEYIKYDSNLIGHCTNNYIKEFSQKTQELKNEPVNENQHYYLFGTIIFLIFIIGALFYKIYSHKK